jgi:hypothetical protein
MIMSEEKKGKGFTFVDKRKTGEAETQAAGQREEGGAEHSVKDEPSRQSETEGMEGKTAPPLPGIDFSSLVLSFSSSAMMHLGLLADPVTQKTEKNLALAKQTIDIIAMLQEKTRGNLSKDEEKFLESILFDLRMNYVEVSKKGD